MHSLLKKGAFEISDSSETSSSSSSLPFAPRKKILIGIFKKQILFLDLDQSKRWKAIIMEIQTWEMMEEEQFHQDLHQEKERRIQTSQSNLKEDLVLLNWRKSDYKVKWVPAAPNIPLSILHIRKIKECKVVLLLLLIHLFHHLHPFPIHLLHHLPQLLLDSSIPT